MPEDPTIVIQADHAWCLNCRARQNVWATHCASTSMNNDNGCGVVFKNVTTPYSGHKRQVQSMRDDLMWKDVQWAG